MLISGRGEGMQFMDDAIQTLVDNNVVSAKEAYMKAIDKARFASRLADEEASTGADAGAGMAAIANNGGQPVPTPVAKPQARPRPVVK